MNTIKDFLDKAKKAREARKIVKPDPNMVQVTHSVHAMASYSPKTRELIRRYSRKNYGELPAESSLGPLPPLLPTPPTK